MEENKRDIYFYIVLGLVFLGGYILILYILELSGMIVFVNRVSLFQRYIAYLGSSVYFFLRRFNLVAYWLCNAF